jgi:hypothetical protein
LGEGNYLMTRAEFLQRLVLNAICDDFENLDQMILGEVAGQALKCGLTIQRSDIVRTLQELVQGGLAKAYDLSSSGTDPFSGEIAGIPPLDVVEEDFKTYFYVTHQGQECHKADAIWWPFDDDGSVHRDWIPPED